MMINYIKWRVPCSYLHLYKFKGIHAKHSIRPMGIKQTTAALWISRQFKLQNEQKRPDSIT